MPWEPATEAEYLSIHRSHDLQLVPLTPDGGNCTWGLWVWHSPLSGKRLPAALWVDVCRTTAHGKDLRFHRWID